MMTPVSYALQSTQTRGLHEQKSWLLACQAQVCSVLFMHQLLLEFMCMHYGSAEVMAVVGQRCIA